ncbi:MAG: hypothetical protein WBE26_19485 [Phycisphaerae bacterium]
MLPSVGRTIVLAFPGAVFLMTCPVPAWGQCEVAKLTASDASPNDAFGGRIATSGDYLVVGVSGDDDAGPSSGSAYVYRREGTSWVEEDKIVASNGVAGDQFGHSVSISGDRILVGAPYHDTAEWRAGAAYVFRRTETGWIQEAELTATGTDLLGWAVAIDGDRALVSSMNTSAAYVFHRDGTEWAEEGRVFPSSGSSLGNFGYSVALSGDVAVVGRTGGNGSAYVFRDDGACWIQEARLTDADPAYLDKLGWSVAVDGERVLAGAPAPYGYGAASVCVFRLEDTDWVQEAKLTPEGVESEDRFGRHVAVDGDYLVAGAYGDDDAGSDSGSVYVFRRQGTSWVEEAKLTASDAAEDDHLGVAVAISGAYVVAGASGNDETGDGAGAVYVFRVLGDPDCDLDGINDACEPDCNENGNPDGCDIVDEVSDDCNANGIPDDCEPDCNGNNIMDSCDIRDGTSDDCNGNGVPDECDPPLEDCNANGTADGCDLAGGTSEDCTENGIPDECEADCNGNTVADSCDILDGTSDDCNGSGVPDECEPPQEDCNDNEIADGCDIANGTSQDCNANGVPDECDLAEGTSPDCNANEIPDACDIDDETSDDCNDNAVPDECEPCGGIEEIPCAAGQFCKFCAGECDVADNVGACMSYPVFCPDIAFPVCGCDAVTYDNECYADCVGVSVAHYGMCGDPPVICCLPTGICSNSWALTCLERGGAEVTACLGDANGDHIDEACDCDANGSPDTCELANGIGEDCQPNGIPDECEIESGTSLDQNENGVPDECECPPSSAPQGDPCVPDGGFGTKSRYLSFTAGEPGKPQAMRVTFAAMPPRFSGLEGRQMWVGQPQPVSESSGSTGPTPPPTFMGASLECDPVYLDWSELDVVHVSDQGVVPGALYEIQAIGDICDAGVEANYSQSLPISTSIWGDVVGEYGGCCTRHGYMDCWSAPNGITNFDDIPSLVDKFRNLTGAPGKARSDIAGEPPAGIPDQLCNFVDISYCVDAFRGLPYPFDGPPDMLCP